MGTSRVVTLSRAIMSPQRKILDRLTGTRHLVVGKCVFGQELSAAAICCGLLILPNPPQSMLLSLSSSLLNLVTPSYHPRMALDSPPHGTILLELFCEPPPPHSTSWLAVT